MMKNMLNKKWKICLFVIIVVGLTVIFGIKRRQKSVLRQMIETEISPQYGSIQLTVSAYGSVRPQNRLKLTPSINGRIEDILVDEGDWVKKGDILAWMSSTERAAILDAARAKSSEALEYWQQVYRPTPLIAPINGVVIVRDLGPGSTVTSSDVILVLSDRLIVEALVDETDIGKIKVGNRVVLRLDAYPLEEINGGVDRISYESRVENNVIMYEIEIVPDEVPEFFRSGMSVAVDFIIKSKKDILHIPLEAVQEENDKTFVLVKKGAIGKPVKSKVELGIADEENIEVISGINATDKIIIMTPRFKLPQEQSGRSPFFPSYSKKKENKNKK